MKAFTYLIQAVFFLSLSNLILIQQIIGYLAFGDADEEWQRYLKENVFYDKDTYYVQKIFTLLNYFGFCILPRPTSTTLKFMEAYYRQYEVDMRKFKEIHEPSYYLERIYKKHEVPIIPFKSHRVWLTDPENPRELKSVLTDPELQEWLGKTNKVLDQSGGENKWQHFLWTMDKSLIPETVEYMASIGVEVREMKELPVFDKDFEKVFDFYLENGSGIGVACDIARMLIVHDEGGLYLDLDAYIGQWDRQLNYYFDFFGFRDREFDLYVLSTWGYGARPQHEILAKHIEIFKRNFFLPIEQKPFNLNQCFLKISGSVLFNTGPFYFGMIYYKSNNLNNNHDVIIENPTYTNHTETTFKSSDNDTFTIKIQVWQYGQGSWTNDYQDAQYFGWPELLE